MELLSELFVPLFAITLLWIRFSEEALRYPEFSLLLAFGYTAAKESLLYTQLSSMSNYGNIHVG